MAKKSDAEKERLKLNNMRLRELVDGSGLTQPEALKVFNRGLGPATYSGDSWKAYLASPSSNKSRLLSDELLKHAEKVFAKLQSA